MGRYSYDLFIDVPIGDTDPKGASLFAEDFASMPDKTWWKTTFLNTWIEVEMHTFAFRKLGDSTLWWGRASIPWMIREFISISGEWT